MITSTRRSLALMLVILLLGSFILPAGAFAEPGSEPASNTSEAAAPTESVPSEAVQNQETTSDDPVESEPAAQPSSGTDGAENTAPGAGSISSGSDTPSLSSSGSSGSSGSISSADGTAPSDTDAAATIEFFLSSAGDDASGDGSLEAPFASIDRAMEAAGDADNVVLILLTDLSISETQQFSGKTVLLTSNEDPCTISPAEDFADPGEPLILVGNPDPNAEPAETELQLEFVTLSDRISESSALTAPIIEICAGGILTAGEEASVLTDGTHTAIHASADSEIHVLEGGHITGDPAIAADENCSVEVDENADVPGYAQPEEEPVTEPAEETEGDLSEGSNPEDPAEGSIDPVDSGVDNQLPPENSDQLVNAANTTPENTPDDPSDTGDSSTETGDNDLNATLNSNNDYVENSSGTEGIITDSVGLFAASGNNALLADSVQAAAAAPDGFSLSAPATISRDDTYQTINSYTGNITGYAVPYTVNFKIPTDLVNLIQLGTYALEDLTIRIDLTLAENLQPETLTVGDLSYINVTRNFNLLDVSESSYSGRTVSITLSKGSNWTSSLPELANTLSMDLLTVLPVSNFAEGAILTSSATMADITYTVAGQARTLASSDTPVTADTKLLGNKSSTLIYDPNGGTGGPETELLSEETNHVLETVNLPTHADVDGYPVIFLGWTSEQTSVIYTSGDTAPATITSVDLAANTETTVFAAYSYDRNGNNTPDVNERILTLTYYYNDGTGSIFTTDSKYLLTTAENEDRNFNIVREEPERDRYSFLGWSESPTGTPDYRTKNNASALQKDEINITKDTPLYAIWDPYPTFTLSFNGKGGSNVPASVSAQSDNIGGTFQASVTIPTTVPTRDKHNFLGWAESLTATEPVYDPGETILIDRDTTLYAVWERNALYTLYFNGTGASDAPAAQTAEAVDGVASMTIPNQTPTRSRYTFLGWATTRYGSASFFPGEEVRLTGGDVTLYAVWQRNGTSTTADGTAPKTGDENNVALYAAVAAGSAAALGAVSLVLRRKRS